MDKIDYLEEERQKIWQRISELDDAIKKKTSDYEKEAKQASKKTSEFRNKSEASLEQIKEYEDTAKAKYEEVAALFAKLKQAENALKKKVEYIDLQHKTISENEETFTSNVQSLEEIFENFEYSRTQVNNLTELVAKINQLVKTANDKRNEINELYIEIMGSETEDENGEIDVIPGLKDELEDSYNEIEKNVNSLQKQLNDTISTYQTTFEQKISEFEYTFHKVNNKIEGLLPNALTVGLCSAYSKKRETEEKEENKQTKHFSWAIIGLIVVSLFPFGVATNKLLNNVELHEVLMQLPRMVLAILPLYIPVLWFAYSASKNVIYQNV